MYSMKRLLFGFLAFLGYTSWASLSQNNGNSHLFSVKVV